MTSEENGVSLRRPSRRCHEQFRVRTVHHAFIMPAEGWLMSDATPIRHLDAPISTHEMSFSPLQLHLDCVALTAVHQGFPFRLLEDPVDQNVLLARFRNDQ